LAHDIGGLDAGDVRYGHRVETKRQGRGAAVLSKQPEIKYVRKRLYVTDTKTPALSIDDDGYVRCGVTQEMRDNDMLVLALTLALRNEDWKKKMIERVRTELVGATTPTSRIYRVMELIKGGD
jgi:hypothetical protein